MPGSRPTPPMLRRARPLLGTLVEIQLRGASASLSAAAMRAAFDEIEIVHRLMSCHDPASDISRFNWAPVGLPIRVDWRTAAVLACAATLHRDSNGAFDCESGLPTTDPSPAWLADGQMLCKQRIARLDLGGIAKGYAVDRAIEVLADHGVESAVVNAGGDLRHLGEGPVPVRVRDPANPACVALTWMLDNAAIATSVGSGLSPAAGAPSRIVDRRGHGVVDGLAGVTVLAPSCMLADALTKVVLVRRAPEHPLLAVHAARTLRYVDGADGADGP